MSDQGGERRSISLSAIPPMSGQRDSRRPIYVQVYDSLHAAICAEGVEAGMRLPSEGSLAEHFGTSRGTVRQALRYLKEDGFLIKSQGRCAVVASQSEYARDGLQAYSNACETCCTLPITRRSMSWQFTLTGRWLSNELAQSEDALICTAEIHYFSGHEPVAKSIWLIPASCLERSAVDPSDEVAMQEFLLDGLQRQVVSANSLVTVAQGAEGWDLGDDRPVICLIEIVFGADGPLGQFKNYLRADCYRLPLRREGRPAATLGGFT